MKFWYYRFIFNILTYTLQEDFFSSVFEAGFFFQSTLEIVEKACNYIKELKAKLENGIVSYLL